MTCIRAAILYRYHICSAISLLLFFFFSNIISYFVTRAIFFSLSRLFFFRHSAFHSLHRMTHIDREFRAFCKWNVLYGLVYVFFILYINILFGVLHTHSAYGWDFKHTRDQSGLLLLFLLLNLNEMTILDDRESSRCFSPFRYRPCFRWLRTISQCGCGTMVCSLSAHTHTHKHTYDIECWRFVGTLSTDTCSIFN